MKLKEIVKILPEGKIFEVRYEHLKDKSKHCGFKLEYGKNAFKTEEEKNKYIKRYCLKCKHNSEICMYGEE